MLGRFRRITSVAHKTVHPSPVWSKKRITAGLGAVALLAGGGFWLQAVHNAPPAYAQTVVTGGLSVSVNPGSVVVGVGTISATVTYSCTDTAAPGGQAALRVSFDQHDNDASGEVGVACGTGDVDKTQTVTAAQVGMSGSQEITAVASLDDGSRAVTDTADTVSGGIFLHLNPSVTFPGDGTITLAGYYNCAATIPTPTKVIVTAKQDNTSNQATAGNALVDITTCDGTNHTWSVTVTGSITGDAFDATVATEADATIPVLDPIQEGSVDIDIDIG